jgi:hypothetical protein
MNGMTPHSKSRRGSRMTDLLSDLKALIRNHSTAHPRGNQVALGPSEVGHPCARNIIQGLLGGQEHAVNPDSDPLPSWLGTAAHARFEQAVELANQWDADNDEIGIDEALRWISEHKVTIRAGLSGTCDLYDTYTKTVIDLKFPGATAMTEYRRNGPSDVYRTQAHLYGRGYINDGYDVKNVAIWFIPRAGLLSTSFLWQEPYDKSLVDSTLERLDGLIILADDMDLEHNTNLLQWIPITPHHCGWCPYWDVTGASESDWACKGNNTKGRIMADINGGSK